MNIWQITQIALTLTNPLPAQAEPVQPTYNLPDQSVGGVDVYTPQTNTSAVPPKIIPPKRLKSPPAKGNCAVWARTRTGIVTGAPVAKLTLAYASKAGYQTTKDKPQVGGIVQTKEGSVGHVAVVVEVKDGKIRTSEANYPVKSRWIEIDDPVIAGFVLPKS